MMEDHPKRLQMYREFSQKSGEKERKKERKENELDFTGFFFLFLFLLICFISWLVRLFFH
jgi:hypothetical protein